MRGKDLKLRKAGTLRLVRKPVALDDDTKVFFQQFIDNLERELLATAKESRSSATQLYTAKELAERGIAYLRACLQYNQPMTRAGLGMFLGFSGSNMVSEDYKEVLPRLLGFIEMYAESALHTRQNPIGAIFVLKNMGWSDNMDVTVRPAPTMTVEERLEAKKRISQFSE